MSRQRTSAVSAVVEAIGSRTSGCGRSRWASSWEHSSSRWLHCSSIGRPPPALYRYPDGRSVAAPAKHRPSSRWSPALPSACSPSCSPRRWSCSRWRLHSSARSCCTTSFACASRGACVLTLWSGSLLHLLTSAKLAWQTRPPNEVLGSIIADTQCAADCAARGDHRASGAKRGNQLAVDPLGYVQSGKGEITWHRQRIR
jgi:hypothetical protein